MAVMTKPKPEREPELVASGVYQAELTEVKTFTNSFGERIGFVFTLRGGDTEGKSLMRSCSPQLTRNSKLGEILKGLLKRELTEAEMRKGLDLETLIGTRCQVLVVNEQGKTGHRYSNIGQVF